MIQYLALIAIAVLIFGGCAPRLADDPMLIPSSAQASRAAAITAYDDQYVKSLTEFIGELKSHTDHRRWNELSLVFALDELADIYAYRLVDFEEADSVNRELETLISRMECCAPDVVSRTLFFPRHRQFYRFVWLDVEQSGGRVLQTFEASLGRRVLSRVLQFGFNLGGRDALRSVSGLEKRFQELFLKTVFPDEFLEQVAKEDLKNVTRRIRGRQNFLDRVLGNIPSTGSSPQDTPRQTNTHTEELRIWNTVLDGGLKDRTYTRTLQVLDRTWQLKDEIKEPEWLRAMETAAEEAFKAEKMEPSARPQDIVRLRFRSGLASMRQGKWSEGVQRLDEMANAVNQYDRVQLEKYDRTVSATKKDLAFALLSVIIPFGQFLTGWTPDDFAYNKRRDQLTALFGEGAHGIAAFLNEHERLAFHYELGYGYEKVGRKGEAIVQYKIAIEIIERQRQTLGSEGKRIQFVKDKEAPYKRLIPLLIEDDDLNGAFRYMERSRSRAFVDMLAGSKLQLGTTSDTQRHQAEIRKQAEMTVLVEQADIPGEAVQEVHGALRGVKIVKGEPIKGEPRSATTDEFDSLATVQTAALDEIGRAAGKDAAIVAFFVSDEKTAVLLLQEARLAGWVKPIGRAALAERVQGLRRLLEVPPGGRTELVLQQIQNRGRELYRDLLGDAGAVLKKSTVYILPHGPLHYLPFAALYDGSAYLVDRLRLSTVPSATVLTYLEKKQRAARGSTVVFANPDLGNAEFDLPYADQEGVAIHARLPEALLLRRRDATEARVRTVSTDVKVLHFAAHAVFNEARPLESAVLLRAGEGQDGALTAAEVFGLKLPGSLVVLSGCETGMGTVAAGDELIGLTRAFMYAGAPQLLATLWQVDDEATSLLMVEFYKQLSDHPAAEALRLAQISVKAKHPHPFYWASFTSFGHQR